MNNHGRIVTLFCLTLLLSLASSAEAAKRKVKVFILAGQSNMEGHGQIRSLERLGEHPEHGHLLKKLKKKNGSWAVRRDVTISWSTKNLTSGPLTVGWGFRDHEIGPELMFGTIMGDRYKEHVLLIKTAWGGKDVFCDFRSPGAGEPTGDEEAVLEKERSKDQSREVGHYYRKMVSEIEECLDQIRDVVPGYRGQGYEIVGMAWFQGWNDYCRWRSGPGIIDNYARNLAAMFRDLRKDLDAPDMAIAIGEMGIGGLEIEKRAAEKNDQAALHMMKFRGAQRAAAEEESLERVVFVPTAAFWDRRLEELCKIKNDYKQKKKREEIKDTKEFPTKELQAEYERLGGHWHCHYNGSAANYSLVGFAMAQALIGLELD